MEKHWNEVNNYGMERRMKPMGSMLFIYTLHVFVGLDGKDRPQVCLLFFEYSRNGVIPFSKGNPVYYNIEIYII